MTLQRVFFILMFVWVNASENISFPPDNVIFDMHQGVCTVSEKFLSVAIDTKFIFKRDLRKLMQHKNFMIMLRSLHPAYLRIGGTAADLLLFDETKSVKNYDDFKLLSLMEDLSWNFEDKGCANNWSWPVLHMSRDEWLTLNALAKKANMNLLFDLNVLVRQPSGKWDPTNALKLIEFSQERNLYVDWQLGNEPNSFCHVFGKEVPPVQLARDFTSLSRLLKKFPLYLKSKLVGPDITAPRGPKKRQLSTLRYLDKFLAKAKNEVSAVSWHQYYLNGRNATIAEFMNPSTLNVLRREIQDVKAVVVKNTDDRFPIWITETASAYGGGAPNLSNSFVSGFIWLDKLGMAALHNLSVVVRQAFIGKNYGLIDEKTLTPNPDFWLSYVFKTLVGPVVLRLETTHQNYLIRLYAHCKNRSRDQRTAVVIFGMNLGTLEYRAVIKAKNMNHIKSLRVDRYILNGADGQVDSRNVQLNGKILRITSSLRLPYLKPISARTNFIKIPPRSIGFFVVSGLDALACKQKE